MYISKAYLSPFICNNIPAAPVYVPDQLIWYSRACGSYHDFLDSRLLLTNKLLNQGFLEVKKKQHFVCCTVAKMTWLTVAKYLCHKWPELCSVCRNQNSIMSSFVTTQLIFDRNNTRGATAYPSGAHTCIQRF